MSLKNSTPTVARLLVSKSLDPLIWRGPTLDPMLCGTGDLSKYDLSLERPEHNQTKFDCLWLDLDISQAARCIPLTLTRPVP